MLSPCGVLIEYDMHLLFLVPFEFAYKEMVDGFVLEDWFPSWVVKVHTELVQITPAVEINVGVNTFF